MIFFIPNRNRKYLIKKNYRYIIDRIFNNKYTEKMKNIIINIWNKYPSKIL